MTQSAAYQSLACRRAHMTASGLGCVETPGGEVTQGRRNGEAR